MTQPIGSGIKFKYLFVDGYQMTIRAFELLDQEFQDLLHSLIRLHGAAKILEAN